MTSVGDFIRMINLASDLVAYIDTIEVFFRKWPIGVAHVIRAESGRMPNIEPCKDRRGSPCGFRLIIQQPTRYAIEILATLQEDLRLAEQPALRRVDLAFDIMSDDAAELADGLKRHLLLWRRPRGWMFDWLDTTTYWVDYSERRKRRKRGSFRNLVLYFDKPSKITGEFGCVHLEIRLMGSDIVRRAGLRKIRSLLQLDPRKLLLRNIRVVEFDLEKKKQQMVRAAVAEDRKQHRGVKVNASNDRFRSTIARRTAGFLKHVFLDRAQLWQSFVGVKFSVVDISGLPFPRTLTWPRHNRSFDNRNRIGPRPKLTSVFNRPIVDNDDDEVFRRRQHFAERARRRKEAEDALEAEFEAEIAAAGHEHIYESDDAGEAVFQRWKRERKRKRAV